MIELAQNKHPIEARHHPIFSTTSIFSISSIFTNIPAPVN